MPGFFNVEKMEPKQDHEKFMRMAIQLSQQNVEQRLGGPFGAVIVKDGMVVARSANKVVPQQDPTAHAEISAIRLACKELNTHNLEGCVIYTSCEPCPMCLGAIYWAHLDTVYFANTKADAAAIGFDDQLIYDELNVSVAERKLPAIQLLRDEAQTAFKDWLNSDQNIHY